MSEEELAADADRSPGVLAASGYIAGGAIAGIFIAIMAGVLTDFTEPGDRNSWTAPTRSSAGRTRTLLALIPFAVLSVLLYLTGREVILAGRRG